MTSLDALAGTAVGGTLYGVGVGPGDPSSASRADLGHTGARRFIRKCEFGGGEKGGQLSSCPQGKAQDRKGNHS
jgi:hypothetical protein